jgi:hypothetical protein
MIGRSGVAAGATAGEGAVVAVVVGVAAVAAGSALAGLGDVTAGVFGDEVVAPLEAAVDAADVLAGAEGADRGTPTLITICPGAPDDEAGAVGAGGAAVGDPSVPVAGVPFTFPFVVPPGLPLVLVAHWQGEPLSPDGGFTSRRATGRGYGRSSGVKMLLNNPSRVGGWYEPPLIPG